MNLVTNTINKIGHKNECIKLMNADNLLIVITLSIINFFLIYEISLDIYC